MKFSVIICAYNVFRKLPITLDSILAQTFLDFEVVIVDGGSTDGTVGVIGEHEKKFNGRLRWISESDTGIYNAMNKGVEMARGEYLVVIGAGDWLEPDALGNVIACIEKKPGADAVYGKTRIWEADRQTSRTVQTMPDVLPTQPMQHPALFYKKNLHDRFGVYNEKYRIVSDYAFCLRAFFFGEAKVVPIDVVTSNFVMDGASSREKECEAENKRLRKELGIKTVRRFPNPFRFLKKKFYGK